MDHHEPVDSGFDKSQLSAFNPWLVALIPACFLLLPFLAMWVDGKGSAVGGYVLMSLMICLWICVGVALWMAFVNLSRKRLLRSFLMAAVSLGALLLDLLLVMPTLGIVKMT